MYIIVSHGSNSGNAGIIPVKGYCLPTNVIVLYEKKTDITKLKGLRL